MELTFSNSAPEKSSTACMILGVFEQKGLSEAAKRADAAYNGLIAGILQGGDFEGKPGQTSLLYTPAGSASARLLLVGLGEQKDFNAARYIAANETAMKAVNALTGVADAINYLPSVAVAERDAPWRLRTAAQAAEATLYRFDRLKSKPSKRSVAFARLTLAALDLTDTPAANAALAQGRAIGQGMALTRDLGNLPPNICTPSYLAEQARALAKDYGLKVTVLETADMERLGMGALLSVARGSHQPAKLIALEYEGKPGSAPIALVGKGITFDTGGISIKPAAAMDEMKYDMCGAASVLGTLKAVAEMKLPLNVVGVIPTTENMPGGNATRPGDIVTSASGQTIEILNTDAEGRLILCDALTYTERFNPAAVVDIATLTGACVIALGHHASGLLANDDKLAQELLKAGEFAGDRAWQLPLWDDYQKALDTNFADMANVGGRDGGTITAACFLSRFTKKFRWAHLDIAGTAWKTGKEKGATGRPVPLLVQFLLDRSR